MNLCIDLLYHLLLQIRYRLSLLQDFKPCLLGITAATCWIIVFLGRYSLLGGSRFLILPFVIDDNRLKYNYYRWNQWPIFYCYIFKMTLWSSELTDIRDEEFSGKVIDYEQGAMLFVRMRYPTIESRRILMMVCNLVSDLIT